jgi:hypothetical protein
MSRTGRLIPLVLASASLLVFGSESAMAMHSAGTNPPNDLARGTVHLNVPFGEFDQHVDAVSGPSGQDPRGHFWATESSSFQLLDFRGRVTCLTVLFNMATIAGVVTQSREPFPAVGTGILMNVQDNGEPGKLDQSVVFFNLPQPPPACPLSPVSVPFNGGNYVVHDAT